MPARKFSPFHLLKFLAVDPHPVLGHERRYDQIKIIDQVIAGGLRPLLVRALSLSVTHI